MHEGLENKSPLLNSCIRKFTLEYALTYTQYSKERPHYVDPFRWRAMIRFIEKNYECQILLHPNKENGQVQGYYVTSPQLPGLVTEGETIKEAVNNARRTCQELIIEYGNEITWKPRLQEIPSGVIEKLILINP